MVVKNKNSLIFLFLLVVSTQVFSVGNDNDREFWTIFNAKNIVELKEKIALVDKSTYQGNIYKYITRHIPSAIKKSIYAGKKKGVSFTEVTKINLDNEMLEYVINDLSENDDLTLTISFLCKRLSNVRSEKSAELYYYSVQYLLSYWRPDPLALIGCLETNPEITYKIIEMVVNNGLDINQKILPEKAVLYSKNQSVINAGSILNVAIYYRNKQALDMFIKNGGDLDKYTSERKAVVQKSLVYVVQNPSRKNIDELDFLFDYGADIDDQDESDATVMMHLTRRFSNGSYMAKKESRKFALDVLTYMLEKKPDLYLQDNDGHNFLDYINMHHLNSSLLVELLMPVLPTDPMMYFYQNGENKHLTAKNVQEARLLIAATAGWYDMVKYLVESGTNINGFSSYKYWTGAPIELAAAFGHEDIFLYLQDKGAIIREDNFRGLNLDYVLAKLQKTKMIPVFHKYLNVQHDVKVVVNEDEDSFPLSNTVDKKYDHALRLAIQSNDVDLIEYYLKLGVNPNAGMLTAVKRKDIKAVSMLLENGADANYLNLADNSLPTLLMLASGKTQGGTPHYPHSIELASLLLSYGADVNAEKTQGNIVSYLVCDWRGNIPDEDKYKLLKMFIDAEADVNVPCKNGATPLANLFKGKYPAYSDRYRPSDRARKDDKKKMELYTSYVRKSSQVVRLIEESGGVESGNPNGSWMKQNILTPIVAPFLKMH